MEIGRYFFCFAQAQSDFWVRHWLLPSNIYSHISVFHSRSVFVLFWSATDHLTYMGVKIQADDWSTCRIVMGQSVEQLQRSLASSITTSGLSIDVIIADNSVQVV
jgi:hypothetical protein